MHRTSLYYNVVAVCDAYILRSHRIVAEKGNGQPAGRVGVHNATTRRKCMGIRANPSITPAIAIFPNRLLRKHTMRRRRTDLGVRKDKTAALPPTKPNSNQPKLFCARYMCNDWKDPEARANVATGAYDIYEAGAQQSVVISRSTPR